MSSPIKEIFEKFSQLRRNWEEIHKDGLKQLQIIYQILCKMSIKQKKEDPKEPNTLNSIFVSVLKNKELDATNEKIVEAKTLESTFKDLKQTQANLLKAYELMTKIIEKCKHLVDIAQMISEEESYYSLQSKRVITDNDLINCLLKLFGMFSKEFDVKASILSEIKYSINLEILNNYIIIWSLQPYLDTQYLIEWDAKYQFEKIPELDKGQAWLQKFQTN